MIIGQMKKVVCFVLFWGILMSWLGCGALADSNDAKIIKEAIKRSMDSLKPGDNEVSVEDYPLVKKLSIYPDEERPEDKKVVNIALIGKLTEVEELNLGANNIIDLSPLTGLNKLTRLDFSLNKVADLSPLAGKNNLVIFNATGNQIKDISPLSGLTKLEVVYLSNNQISDISPLLQLKSLKEVTLKGNKVSAADIGNLKKALPKGCYFEHD